MESNRINIKDVSFVLPIRIDSVIRLENILMVVDFLTTNFSCHIFVLEADSYCNKFLSKLLPSNVSYSFVEDYDPIFHRTKYLNKLVKKCDSEYVAVWDVDVIIPKNQILTSVSWLRKGETQFVFPYKEKFLDISYILRELYFKTKDIDVLMENKGKMNALYQPNPVGGGFIAKRQTYIKAGLENENFYGWGNEDRDRINRWKILGCKYKRVPGPLFHLTHERGKNSKYYSEGTKERDFSELLRIRSMSRNELLSEIKKWNSKL